MIFLGDQRKLLVLYPLQERDCETLWTTEDRAEKKTFLWRQVAQGSVAIREKRVRAVPGTHGRCRFCYRRYEQRHRVISQSKGGEKR